MTLTTSLPSMRSVIFSFAARSAGSLARTDQRADITLGFLEDRAETPSPTGYRNSLSTGVS